MKRKHAQFCRAKYHRNSKLYQSERIKYQAKRFEPKRFEPKRFEPKRFEPKRFQFIFSLCDLGSHF
jgi:hypothetical protein